MPPVLPTDQKTSENSLLGGLVFASIVIGLLVFGSSRGLYYYVQYFWDDLFSDVKKFGEQCEAGLGDWTAATTLESALANPPPLSPLPMPYYSAPLEHKPDVKDGQYLYSRCKLDLSGLRKGGFGWMRLHYVHGDTAIFLGGRLKQTVDDLGVAEFPLVDEDKVAGAELVLISKPNELKKKLLGLPTSMPLIYTDSRVDLARPNIGATFDYNLRPTYWLNWSLVFLLVFAVAWVGGLRREDVGWLVVAMASNAAMDFAIFSRTNSVDPTWRAVTQVMAFSTNIAICCFALAFLEAKARWSKPIVIYLICMVAYTPLCFLPRGTLSTAYTYFYIPTWIQIALYGSIAGYGLSHRTTGSSEYPRRIAFVIGFCLFLALGRVVDLFIFIEKKITFSEILTEAGITGFCTFLIFDLVVSYRRYLAEKMRRMETEARSREFEAVARVTQMLAHDVRKPYQTLLSGLRVLESENSSGGNVVGTKRLRSEVERALGETNAMLSDIMDVGAAPPSAVAGVDIPQVAAVCVQRAIEANRKPGVKVRLDWRGPARLSLDPRRFQRVLMNLVENAVQAMPGDGTLKLSSAVTALNGTPAVRLTVWNSGSFIPDADRARIFDPFFTKNKSQGTGLGLAIVRKFVEAEGGQVHCHSTAGEGTGFELVLPTKPSEASMKAGRVALLDDDVFVREIWKQGAPGLTIETFESPAAFWEAAGEDPVAFAKGFDLVVTDYYFGRGEVDTGGTFAARLKALLPACRIVLLSDAAPGEDELPLFTGQLAKTAEPADSAQWL